MALLSGVAAIPSWWSGRVLSLDHRLGQLHGQRCSIYLEPRGKICCPAASPVANLRKPSLLGQATEQQQNQKGNREILEARNPQRGLNSATTLAAFHLQCLGETMLSSCPGLMGELNTGTEDMAERRQGRLKEIYLNFECK